MKYKRFVTSAGMEVLVGQDDISNDELTFRVGHANDIWLHVSGAPGSHVLLRCSDARAKPDRNSLREAAGLAAWFSKMREGGKVAVHYCPVRQVSKPRRTKAGSVTIKQAQKVIVRPALLEES